MSLGGAFTAAVTGMDAQSRALGAISDNIANSQTTGYKRVETAFSTLLTISNAQQHQPGGVLSRPVRTTDLQGPIQQSSTVTNLAISGDGMFAVSEVVGKSGTTPIFAADRLYTRAGDFAQDEQGYLVNTAGYYLNGWAIDPITGIVQKNALTPIQVTQLKDNPQQTRNIDYDATLPTSYASGSYTVPTSGPLNGYKVFPPTTVSFYDQLGTAHSVDVTWAKDPANNDTWRMTFTPQDPTVTVGNGLSYVDVKFAVDSNETIGGSTVPNLQAGSIISVAVTDSGGTTSTAFNGTGTTAAAVGMGATIPLTFNIAGPTGSSQTLNLNLGQFGVAQQTSMQTVDSDTVKFGSARQDGLPPGSYAGLEIDKQGFVTISYDNGNRKTVYQIPVAKFPNYNGLQPESGNAFRTTPESGQVTMTDAGGDGTGTILSSSTESSNVDIAAEFTKMIQTQRAYTANTKVITTANEMYQDIDSLIR